MGIQLRRNFRIADRAQRGDVCWEENQEVGCGTEAEGKPRRRWMNCVKDDMSTAEVTEEDAQDRARWRRMIGTGDHEDRN